VVTFSTQVENLGLTFVCTIDKLGTHTEMELLPGGREKAVTVLNRARFLELKVQKQLMEPILEQINALREGMASLLPGYRSWADVFEPLTEEVRK
jgi:hypothetical protein